MHATSAALTPSSTLFQFTLDNQEGPETQTQALSFKTPSMCPSWIDRMERSIQRPGRLRSRGVFSGAAPRQIPAQQAKTAKHKLFLIPEKVLGLFENDSCLRISFNPCCSIHGVAAVQFHRGGDSSGQFSLQSFLPASGMPVSQALFQARSFLDISLIPCTETAPAAAGRATFAPNPAIIKHRPAVAPQDPLPPIPLARSQENACPQFPPPQCKKPGLHVVQTGLFHCSIKGCGGADGWPAHPSSGSAARPPTRSVTESPPACRHRPRQAVPGPKDLPHGHWPEDRHRPGRHRAARRRRRAPAALQVCGTSAAWCYLPCGPISSIQHHWADRSDRSA